MSIFLSHDEIHELTGYTTRQKQEEWLTKRCWIYEVSALGRVKILKKYAESKLGIPVSSIEQSTEPDFTRL